MVSAVSASGNVALVQVSSDDYTNPDSNHRTEVEADTFSFGSTIVSTFQVGRYFNGGATNNGWATSTDGGSTWTRGYLPRTTRHTRLGTYDRLSDPTVTYDRAHNVWLISSLALRETPSIHGVAVIVSRSTNGGTTWSAPVVVATGVDLDKNWITCDTTPASPFYGRCYTEWDDHAAGNRIYMSTSADGGLTWGPSRTTANNATGLGGQPVVQPNGTVVVPINNANASAVLAFRSTDGGATWSAPVTVSAIARHVVAGNLRSLPLISAEIDGAGKVYVVWQDCRFRRYCRTNDIVLSTSTNGLSWAPVTRVPVDGPGVDDRFIPGLGVDPATSGAGAHLGLTYHSYSAANCTVDTCQLNVGFISSTDGGVTWSAPLQLAGPMSVRWLPLTSQGYMTGDYVSTSFSGGTAHPVFAVANPPSGGLLDVAMYSPATGLVVGAGATASSSQGAAPVPAAAAGPPLTDR